MEEFTTCALCGESINQDTQIKVTSEGRCTSEPYSAPVEAIVCRRCWEVITGKFIGKGEKS